MKSVDLIQSDRWLRVVCEGVATLLTVCVAVVLMAILYPASTLVSDVQAGPISSSAQGWLLTSGGPDTFGYTFKDSNEPDGPTYTWEEISSTGTQVTGWTSTDDGYAGPIPIGFDFNFYGNNYDEVYVGSNGYLSFGRGYGNIPGGSLPQSWGPNNDVALFGGDMYLYNYGSDSVVYYQTLSSPTRFVLEFVNLYYCCDQNTSHTFEVILYPNGDILNQYQSLNGTSTDYVGIENADGTDGLGYGASLADDLAIRYYYPVGVFLTPADQTGFGPAGTTISYTLWLANQTDATDSFTLTVQPGNTWTTTLSLTQTGTLSDGESLPFTIWVEIPPSASPGDVDNVAIRASSVASPTVYHDTATISTTAVSDLAYVTLSNDALVAVVETASHAIVDNVDVGSAGCDFPWRATLSPDRAYVYVACRHSGNVVVIETTGNTMVKTIENIPFADGIAFTRDGAYALVGSRHVSQVTVVDTGTYFVTTISTPSNVRSIAAHPYLDRAYATSGNGNVLVIDTVTRSIITSIPVGDDPWDVAVSPDGQWVFAGSRRGDGLAVIDASDNTLHTTVTGLGDLTGLDVAPDGSKVYASGLWDGVHIVDGVTFNHTTTITDVGRAWEVAVTRDGSELYVGNTEDQIPAVTVMGSLWMIDRIGMPGWGARGIAACPQHVAAGVFLSPPEQTNPGGRGQVVAHQGRLINATGATDSFGLMLASHVWDTALSTDSIGPVAYGDAVTFTMYVTVPVDADWYSTDVVQVSAASVASPTVYSDTATFTTQAYAPPEISVSPGVLTSTQYVNQIVTKPLTISNGSGVTLTFDIAGTSAPDAVLLMHLDEPAGATTFQDASGNDNHGSCSGGSCPIAGVDGKFGRALSFDGADDYVEIPNESGLNPQQAIAISAWIYPDDWNGNRRIVQKGPSDNQYRFLAEDGWLRFDLSGVNSLDTTLPAIDVWHHVVGVYDGTVMQIWVDGQKRAEENASGTIDTTSDPLFIGTKDAGAPSGDYFYGLIDQVAIYDRALSAEEVEALYLCEVGGEDVPWLSKDPISGTVATNSSAPIQVTFDATGLQPDTYTTEIVIRSNDPLTPSVSVPTTMTVIPTANMGWVEGAVTDVATGDPLEATIVALGQPYTVTTDPDTGAYIFWLDEGNYTIQVAADGYVSDMAVVDITAQQGVARSFGLVLNVPVLGVTPASLGVTHDVGDVTRRMMTITNNGPAPLTFELRDSDAGHSPLTALVSHLSLLGGTTSPAEPDRPHAFTTAYVTLSDDNLVALVDTTNHTEIGTVNVGAAGCDHPWRAAMSPDGDFVYVSCRNSGNVVIIETAGNTVMTTREGIFGADGIAFVREGAYALVGSRWGNHVAVVDPGIFYSVTTYIETPSYARSVAAHPYLDVAYATSGDGTIQVIDTTTFSITASIPVGDDPHDVAVSPDGRWVFAGSRQDDGLAVIDADSNTLYTTVTGPGTLSLLRSLTGLEVAPDGSAVYACGLSDGVHVIDGMTLRYITTVPGVGDTWEAAVTCDGSELYVGNKGGQIPVINTATFSVTEQIPLSNSGAHGIAICPQHVARDVPWLSQDPITGAVPGYSSTPIQVTFDATGIQPGTYTAELVVWSNDPFTPATSVPVTMTVEPTADMGCVTGSVHDAWTGQPLTDATVELVGVYSMTASSDYTIWASAAVYSLTAYASGYASITQPVTIVAGDVVTANLALEPARPRLEWATDDISAMAAEGSSVTQTLTISNTGPLPLDIALFESNPTAVLQAMSPLSPADLNGKRILYDRTHGEPDSSEYSSLINDAISAGAAITESWYTIDAALLEGYDVLWVNCCGYTAWSFAELNAVSDWLSEGGAVFVQGENSDATDGAASVLGISYQSGSCNYGTTTDIADHPISEGVNAVSVEWTCWRLAPSLGVDIVVSDSEGQPHVVAQEQNGGKMVVVASEDFIDWHINNNDNRTLANNILAWLASPAYSDVPWLSETPQADTIPGHSSLPVTLGFDATTLSQSTYQAVLAIEHSDLFQPSPVELPVTLSVVAPQAALSLTPALQERRGTPGETVVHTFNVTNQGNANDTFNLNASGVWTPTLSADATGLLGVQESFVFTLGVTIPSTATYGISDTTTITARSTLDSGVSESVQAVTTVGSPYEIYLPLVMRNSL